MRKTKRQFKREKDRYKEKEIDKVNENAKITWKNDKQKEIEKDND